MHCQWLFFLCIFSISANAQVFAEKTNIADAGGMHEYPGYLLIGWIR